MKTYFDANSYALDKVNKASKLSGEIAEDLFDLEVALVPYEADISEKCEKLHNDVVSSISEIIDLLKFFIKIRDTMHWGHYQELSKCLYDFINSGCVIEARFDGSKNRFKVDIKGGQPEIINPLIMNMIKRALEVNIFETFF